MERGTKLHTEKRTGKTQRNIATMNRREFKRNSYQIGCRKCARTEFDYIFTNVSLRENKRNWWT